MFSKIFNAVSTRIKSNWAHYLFLKQLADMSKVLPPSTVACHPAPGRRLLIIRNDNQSPSASLFLGFDGIMSSNSQGTPGTTQATSYKRHSSLAVLKNLDTSDFSNSKTPTDVPTAPNKKRWTFMGKMLPSAFTTPSESSSPTGSRTPSPPSKTLEEARRETALARQRPPLHSKNSSTDSETPPSTSTHRAYSFKFSLEWAQHFEKPGQGQQPANGSRGGSGFNMSAERRISPPRLPAAAQAFLGAKVPNTNKEVLPRDPKEDGGTERVTRSKYAGRALSEWAIIVGECNNFVERRKAEGVPGLKWVEVPTMGVDGFRKFG
jgi:hypothetical protein